MRNKYLHLFLASNAIVVLDQFSKFMVATHIPRYGSIPVVDRFFNLTHIRNSGVAFGLFAAQTSEYKSIFFIAVSLVAIAAILSFFHHTHDDKRMVQNGLILIFSGAVGNMIDRVLYKEVIDFLDFFYNGYHWPAFNLADSCITVGVGFMMVDLFFQKRPDRDPVEPCQ